MQLGDLKKAVEDVLLKPETNDVTRLDERASIAALDLCQSDASTSSGVSPSTSRTCSSSTETVCNSLLATSTSLDHIVLRHPPGRPSLASRRSSRILPHHKRKRSNSLSSYYKGGTIPPPSSIAKSPPDSGQESTPPTHQEQTPESLQPSSHFCDDLVTPINGIHEDEEMDCD